MSEQKCKGCNCTENVNREYTGEEFELKTFNDFMKLKPEQMDDCLRDFNAFIRFTYSMVKTIGSLLEAAKMDPDLVPEEERAELQEYLDSGAYMRVEGFKWRDDGKPGCLSLNVNVYSEDDDGNRVLVEEMNLSEEDVTGD